MEKISIQCNCGNLTWEPPAEFDEIPGFAKDFILDSVRVMLHSVTRAARHATTDPVVAAAIVAKMMLFSEELSEPIDGLPDSFPSLRQRGSLFG